MIWKRSAVLRFYSVCGLLLQGNPRPAAGSINFTPIPHHPRSSPHFHCPPSRLPGPGRPLPLLPGAAGGSGRVRQPQAAEPRLCPARRPRTLHPSPFHSPELPPSHSNPTGSNSHPLPTSHASGLATCACSEHPTLRPTPISHLLYHASDRPSPSPVIFLTSPSLGSPFPGLPFPSRA